MGGIGGPNGLFPGPERVKSQRLPSHSQEPPIRPIVAVVVAMLASLATAGAAEPCLDLSDPACRASREPGCRKVAEEMLAIVKSTAPEATAPESHRRRHAELLARVEKAIAEGRAQGEGPCETLAGIQKILVTQ